jgi:hypothetical protein
MTAIFIIVGLRVFDLMLCFKQILEFVAIFVRCSCIINCHASYSVLGPELETGVGGGGGILDLSRKVTK